MRYGLPDDVLKKIIDTISQNPKIKKIVLYGSRAKGNYKRGSDIDVALIGNDLNVEDLNKIDLDLELDELYLPYSFDLSIFEKIENKDLLDHINRIGAIIYQSTQRKFN